MLYYCQIISFKKNKIEDNTSSIEKIGKYLYNDEISYDNFIQNEGNKYIDTIIEYVTFLEKRKEEAIIYKNKEFIEVFNDRKKLYIAFELLVLYYKDVLNKKLGLNVEYFNDYIDSIENLTEDLLSGNISQKIKILVDNSINIKYNLNANLLIDKVAILLSEV